MNLVFRFLLLTPKSRFCGMSLCTGTPRFASAAKLIRTYLAYYQATGDKLALAKAKALGDAAVNNQRENGLSPTGWFGNYDEYHNWINCHIATMQALQEPCALK